MSAFQGEWCTEYRKRCHVVDLDDVDTTNITKQGKLYEASKKKVQIGDIYEGADPLRRLLGRGDPFGSDVETILGAEDYQTSATRQAETIALNKSRAEDLAKKVEDFYYYVCSGWKPFSLDSPPGCRRGII